MRHRSIQGVGTSKHAFHVIGIGLMPLPILHGVAYMTRTEIFLGHGALFQLGAKTNSSFYHAVKQTTAASTGPRVSITFRRVLTYKTDLGELTGQGANYPTLNWPTELMLASRVG